MQRRANLKRRAVLVAAIAMAALTAVPAIHSVAQALRPTANVRDYGAVGDGQNNDSAAIQRANDAVAHAGGGVVFFPAGTYIAANVSQDSNVEFAGNGDATLKHPDGVSGIHVVKGRVFTTKGTIVEGSTRLTVSNTRGVLPGSVIGIRGAGGASTVQTSKLSTSVGGNEAALSAAQAKGWGKSPSYLLVDNEVVAYSGMSGGTFLNVQRGLLGTGAVRHGKGATVSLLRVLYARVLSVGTGWIQIDRHAVQGVKSTDVYVGSINMAVRGLVLDGSRVPNGSTNNPFPLKYELARWLTIDGNTIHNGDHGAISVDKGTSDSVIANNLFFDNGTPSGTFGAGVWLFRGTNSNVITNNEISGDSNHGIMVDDRSESASEWDAPSDGNVISANRIDIPPVPQSTGIWVVGSAANLIEDNDVASIQRGISVTLSTQGTRPATAYGTVVRNNRLTGHGTGLFVSGTNNWFERNQIWSTQQPIRAAGTGNQYVENAIY